MTMKLNELIESHLFMFAGSIDLSLPSDAAIVAESVEETLG